MPYFKKYKYLYIYVHIYTYNIHYPLIVIMVHLYSNLITVFNDLDSAIIILL